MVLAGGGAPLLRNLDERLRLETGVAVHVAEDPLGCVAVGSGRYLEELGRLGRTRSSG
jgi:rod shape-determining protein MreB